MVAQGTNNSFRSALRGLVVGLWTALTVLCAVLEPAAAPLDWEAFGSLAAEGFFSWQDGRMGFNQDLAATPAPGTINDLRTDLGLPVEGRSLKLSGSLRVLEHHLLRAYGYIPEFYQGRKTLSRQLQTLNVVYPAGSEVDSLLERGSFGMGYDLDFAIGSSWLAGLNGDFKYIHTRLRMLGPEAAGREDTISVDELIPCVGAHGEGQFTRLSSIIGQRAVAGAYARMTHGMWPNFVNYVDIQLGLSLQFRTRGLASFKATVGYEHESLFHNQEPIAGKVLEMKRDGITVSLAGAF